MSETIVAFAEPLLAEVPQTEPGWRTGLYAAATVWNGLVPGVAEAEIVDGKELDMGTLSCRFARETHRLTCTFERGAFVYAIDGDRMHGTLDLTDGTRFRVIEVERVR
jgi:hypothetical protein